MTNKIKISEIFHSLQGEGLYVGVPSVFIRTFGCNFRCKGFGMEMVGADNLLSSIEADKVVEMRKDHPEWTYEDLPLVSTGCDSYGAVYPKFKDLSTMMDIDEIIDAVEMSRLEHEPQSKRNGLKSSHIVITGGEPLLGWQRSYPALLDALAEEGYRHITFETNGTQAIDDEFYDYLMLNHISGKRLDITFSVSPKLRASGEGPVDALKPEVVNSYSKFGKVYLKFVVATARDVDDVHTFVYEYKKAGWMGEVYLMPLGGTAESYNLNAPQVAELAMYSGYRYSPRLQVDLWANAWGT